MVRPRVRRKVRNPSSKVSRKNANKKKTIVKSNPIIASAWDKKLTLRQNYARLGLCSRTNGITGGVDSKPTQLLDPTEEALQEEEEAKWTVKEKLLAEGAAVGGDSAADGEIDPTHIPQGMGFIERDEDGNVVNVIVGTGEVTDVLDSGDLPPVPAKTHIVKQLEEIAANGLKAERHQSGEEKTWVEKLIAKYGDDYQKMFRDRKLNPNQQTATQIRKRVEKYLAKQKSA